jgi:hypothetical protein
LCSGQKGGDGRGDYGGDDSDIGGTHYNGIGDIDGRWVDMALATLITVALAVEMTVALA